MTTKTTTTRREGMIATTVLLRPDERKALFDEASSRASEGGRVDVSAVIRELVDREFKLAAPRSSKTD